MPRVLINKLLLAIAFFALVGFADSAYLLASHYFTLPLPCSITHGCETVLTSPYSMVGPIPLAAFGVAFYLLVLFVAIFLYTSQSISKFAKDVVLGLTLLGFLMSLSFELLQVFVIHAICQYCALSALCSLALLICGAWFVRAFKRLAQ